MSKRRMLTGCVLVFFTVLIFSYQNFKTPIPAGAVPILSNSLHNYNVYSPFLLKQESSTYMYFGGFYTDRTSRDAIYRADCTQTYSCNNPQLVIDPPEYLCGINDPTIVKIPNSSQPGGGIYIMYFTTMPKHLNGNCEREDLHTLHHHRIYYSVSSANDGAKWSPPEKLLDLRKSTGAYWEDPAWLPSAVYVNGRVYLYVRHTQHGILRYDVGSFGNAVQGAPIRVISPYPYLNHDIVYKSGDTKPYRILGERILDSEAASQALAVKGVQPYTVIDYLESSDGVNWDRKVANYITPDVLQGQRVVRTPAPHPDNFEIIYTGQTAGYAGNQADKSETYIQKVFNVGNALANGLRLQIAAGPASAALAFKVNNQNQPSHGAVVNIGSQITYTLQSANVEDVVCKYRYNMKACGVEPDVDMDWNFFDKFNTTQTTQSYPLSDCQIGATVTITCTPIRQTIPGTATAISYHVQGGAQQQPVTEEKNNSLAGNQTGITDSNMGAGMPALTSTSLNNFKVSAGRSITVYLKTTIASSQNISFSWKTVNGTAISGLQYTGSSGMKTLNNTDSSGSKYTSVTIFTKPGSAGKMFYLKIYNTKGSSTTQLSVPITIIP